MSNGVCRVSSWLPRAIRFARVLQRPLRMAAALQQQQVGTGPVGLALFATPCADGCNCAGYCAVSSI